MPADSIFAGERLSNPPILTSEESLRLDLVDRIMWNPTDANTVRLIGLELRRRTRFLGGIEWANTPSTMDIITLGPY